MFTIQTLIAIAAAIGVAVAWATAMMIAGAMWQRKARAANAARHVTTADQHPAQTDRTREPVLH
jgi:uncharacterized membrane protein YciS (DUF1049 family)